MSIGIIAAGYYLKPMGWILVLLGVVTWFGGCFIDHLALTSALSANTHFIHHVLSFHKVARVNIYDWLISIPLACVLAGTVLIILRYQSRGFSKSLKRMSAGKPLQTIKMLPTKKIQKQLNTISTTAVDSGSILGVNLHTGDKAILSDSDANLHTLAIGTTGSGKTTVICNVISSVIQRGHPLIYVDGKGDLELAHRIQDMAKKQNRPFYLFSMVGDSVKYNPIANGGITSKKDRIIELREWTEDHYRKIAEGYLQTVFALLERFKITVDLCGLSHYLAPDVLYGLARQHKDAGAIRQIEVLEKNQRDISSLVAEINNMANSEIGRLFDTGAGNSLVLEEALSQNAVVYFCLQPLKFPSYAECLGKLIINDIKALASSQLERSDKQKIYTIFDEFSVFAGDQIVNLINQGRSAGIHAILATQSLSDIQKKGGNPLVGQVLNNCNNYLILRQNHHVDAEQLAQVIGTTDAYQITTQIDQQARGGAGTVRQAKEFIVHPDEIKRLPIGQAVFVNKQRFNIEVMLSRCLF
ncbi:MAG: type IV secretion system DNA-binding domain-containing protein [Coxiellaceae bacterium]|nr:type IV secretion system DNA-binding domain-containing protein [Coxiellaceae bacterium]